MKWQKALRSLVIVLSIWSCFVAIGSERTNAQVPTEGRLAILQLEDPAPPNAEKLTQRYFSGKDYLVDCSYYELLLSAERFARANGANLLKIVSRSSHSRTQLCDGLEVAFYRSDNPLQDEQTFRWDGTQQLSWDDFRGPIRRGAGDNIAAETSCGIAIETSLVSFQGTAKVYVFNTFDKQKSWVRDGYDRPDVLQHEQGHWDICELYSRKMQARFDAAHITGADLKREVARIYDEVSDEYVARQEQYEQETQHGVVAPEQDRWTGLIREELNASSVSKL